MFGIQMIMDKIFAVHGCIDGCVAINIHRATLNPMYLPCMQLFQALIVVECRAN